METNQCQYWISNGRKCPNKAEPETGYCSRHPVHSSFPQPEECVVCTDPFLKWDNPLLPCGHWIHMNCIYQSGKAQCPVCRCDLVLTDHQMKNMKRLTPVVDDPFYADVYGQPDLQIGMGSTILFGVREMGHARASSILFHDLMERMHARLMDELVDQLLGQLLEGPDPQEDDMPTLPDLSDTPPPNPHIVFRFDF